MPGDSEEGQGQQKEKKRKKQRRKFMWNNEAPPAVGWFLAVLFAAETLYCIGWMVRTWNSHGKAGILSMRGSFVLLNLAFFSVNAVYFLVYGAQSEFRRSPPRWMGYARELAYLCFYMSIFLVSLSFLWLSVPAVKAASRKGKRFRYAVFGCTFLLWLVADTLQFFLSTDYVLAACMVGAKCMFNALPLWVGWLRLRRTMIAREVAVTATSHRRNLSSAIRNVAVAGTVYLFVMAVFEGVFVPQHFFRIVELQIANTYVMSCLAPFCIVMLLTCSGVRCCKPTPRRREITVPLIGEDNKDMVIK